MANPHSTTTDNNPETPGLSVDDVFFILFRHKWKIIICAALGMLGALGLILFKPPVYMSEAKILIQYVVDAETAAPSEDKRSVRAVSGDNILNSEMEILRSMDLALGVVDAFGPEKILARVGGGNDRYAAANLVRRGITLLVPERSSVIIVVYSHIDPEVVQPVLTQLVSEYVKRHLRIHQGVGATNNYFLAEAGKVEQKLRETEEELRNLRKQAGIVSLEETKKSMAEAVEGLKGELRTAQAELAQQEFILEELERLAGASNGQNDPNVERVDEDTTSRYQALRASLMTMRAELQTDRLRFRDEHPKIQGLQARIKEMEREKEALEEEHPQLVLLSPPATGTNAAPGSIPSTRLMISSLQGRILTLTNQLAQAIMEAEQVMEAEPALKQLQSKRDFLENQLNFYRSSNDRAQDRRSVDQVANLDVLQAATPPVPDSRKLKKPVVAILAAGFLGGIALAFLIELILDRSVKRPADLERKLNLPLFMSIPDLKRNGRLRLGLFGRKKKAVDDRPPPRSMPPATVPEGNGELLPVVAPEEGEAPWQPTHALSSYFEALRDRLITYFEVRNMTHKPKLVGVTSCNHGAGVSTLAAGLAASLSETGDGNVLLVDMNGKAGTAYQFRWGKPGCALSEVLATEKPENALVHQNLYMASARETGENELAGILPKRFANLVPQMKTSDFDYIIFDLPPVNHTSVTPRLSSYMDMVMMVVEAEKSGLEAVKRANHLLQDAGASSATVLNKHHKYVPDSLSQDL